jgi:hypothetical protein
MDRAYQAVAASAGGSKEVSYFANDRGPELDWQSAGMTAAETVGAWVASDLISEELLSFIVEPWKALLDEREDSEPSRAC